MKKQVLKRMLMMAVFWVCIFNLEKIYAQENTITDEVEEFAQVVTKSNTVEISDYSTIYENGEKFGYYFEFEDNGKYLGYIIYSFETDDIEEYSFDGGLKYEFNNESDVIERKNFLDYEISENSNLAQQSATDYDSIDDMITDKPSVASNSRYTYCGCKYLSKRSMYCEDDLERWGLDHDSWFGCSVVAMLNVCKQAGLFDMKNTQDLVTAYCNLHTMSNTNKKGQTKDDVLGDTIQRFAKASKNINVTYTYKQNPTTSYFISAVNNDYSSILGLQYKAGANDKDGHAVSVNGYVQYKNNATNNVRTYLCVADGWYERTRYICLSTAKPIFSSGTVIKYKIK